MNESGKKALKKLHFNIISAVGEMLENQESANKKYAEYLITLSFHLT